MKLGVIATLCQIMPLAAMLDHVAEMGLQAMEFGSGAFPSEQPSAMGWA
jgi:sugar phosphate isomerase/epimerase